MPSKSDNFNNNFRISSVLYVDNVTQTLDLSNIEEKVKNTTLIKYKKSHPKTKVQSQHINLSSNESPSVKSLLIQKLKQEVKRKFVKGEYLTLRIKSNISAKRINRIYQVKQIVWSIDDTPIKAIVVKQVYGPNYNMCSLNHQDCKRIHVKYEQGLQFLSMDLNWVTPSNEILRNLKIIS